MSITVVNHLRCDITLDMCYLVLDGLEQVTIAHGFQPPRF